MVELDLGGVWRYQPTDSLEFARLDWDDGRWPTMAIPQNWFLAGLDHHGVVWFRHEFEVDLLANQFATLQFDGVDYFADVYLNGVHLGSHEGYFEPFSFEVTAVLQNGRNQLAIRVDSPLEPVGLDGWHMRKRLIKGVLNHHDCRPGGGWVATGQAYNTGGIWNKVRLLVHSAITVDRVLLQADLAHEPPVLQGQIMATNRGEETAVSLTLTCAPENFNNADTYQISLTLTLPPGQSQHTFALPVPDVRRWQPWDRGDPHLYQFTIHHSQFSIDYSSPVGFRTIEIDAHYRWLVNGRTFFPRGSNYIATQWLSETMFPIPSQNHPFPPPDDNTAVDDWFTADVQRMRAANINLIRVHAHVLPPAFHHACDRAGILVWQDFPFQWGYSDDPDFHQEAERQVRAMINQLYNHPSIALWCIHNESPWDADWMAEEAGGSYDPTHNRALDQHLQQVAQTVDPHRYVQRNSGTGDEHVYPGWYYGHWRDFDGGTHGAPFPTEFGAQAIPNAATTRHMFAQLGPDAGHAALRRFKQWVDAHPRWALAKEMPPLALVPPDLHDAYEAWRTWRFHDFQPAENLYHAGIQLGDSLEAFIASSQAYQNNLLQFAIENFRRQKYDKINGLMQFMFVDPWPAITWAVLDYWRQPKPSFYVLKAALQPLLICAALPGLLRAGTAWAFDLIVINDWLEEYAKTTCRWRIVNGRMQEQQAGLHTFAVPADSKTAPVAVPAQPLPAGTYRLILTLHQRGDLLSQNGYSFEVLPA